MVAPKKVVPKKKATDSPYQAVKGDHCTHCGKALRVAFIVQNAKMGFTCVKKSQSPSSEVIQIMRRDRRALRKKLAAIV